MQILVTYVAAYETGLLKILILATAKTYRQTALILVY